MPAPQLIKSKTQYVKGRKQCENKRVREKINENRLNFQKKKEAQDFSHKFLKSTINLTYAFLQK